MATPLLKRKSSLIVLCLISTFGAVFSVYGFIHQVRRAHAQAVLREFSAAYEKSSKFPPGLMRAEDALFRFKRIDPGYASKEFKQAMSDYVAAFQGTVDALKANQDISRFDIPMANAKERMDRRANE